ncbi:DUF2946 family protein [Sphingosinicella sp. BN140058]|uniref:DUF2946 family protein n=1 Tax=Sphingosinicella sp. BN140058 TaxID=1892855 RepID=UPI001013AE2F|nr:DUF2946 family protein [Sphingosinicella sp. BN140058]QAY77549.1 hypothetical protein ETR14_14310 [Sphingosinicella sp. BN140058]
MTGARAFLLQHRALAAFVLAGALLMRVLVPSGYMPTIHHGAVAIVPCSGAGPVTIEAHAAVAHGSGHHGDEQKPHEGSQGPCLFSSLAAPALAGADPFLIVAAFLFVMVQALRVAQQPPVTRASRLRPPLRGPPALS